MTTGTAWPSIASVLLAWSLLDTGGAEAGTQSDANKADCVRWCAEHHDDGCERCASYSACGAGYESMKKFGTLGTWYACRKNDFGRRGEANEGECEDYCRSNPACVGCTAGPCGSGVKVLKTFTGEGKNWHACQKTDWAQHSDEAHAAAARWCSDYTRSSGEDCRIVKSAESCPDGFYKSERLKVQWGRDYKACLQSKSDTQRVKDCSAMAAANVEKALDWINTHYDTILSGYRLQPSDYRNRRAHDRFDRKFPQVTVLCEDHRNKCDDDSSLGGWSTAGRQVHLCYDNHQTFCELVATIVHEAAHNAWTDDELSQHVGDPGPMDDTVYQLGYRANDLCTGTNARGTGIAAAHGTNYDYSLR